MRAVQVVHAMSSLRAGIAIGGDVFPGSTLSDHCLRYQNIPEIKLIVVLGELGGQVHRHACRVNRLRNTQGSCLTRARQGEWSVQRSMTSNLEAWSHRALHFHFTVQCLQCRTPRVPICACECSSW